MGGCSDKVALSYKMQMTAIAIFQFTNVILESIGELIVVFVLDVIYTSPNKEYKFGYKE